MNEPHILSTLRRPARFDAAMTARELGFQDHDIPLLIRAGLLKPLGNPAPNAPKFFPRCEIDQKAADVKWLDKATRVISDHWRQKNQKRQGLILRKAD